jgi:hypothetical protein
LPAAPTAVRAVKAGTPRAATTVAAGEAEGVTGAAAGEGAGVSGAAAVTAAAVTIAGPVTHRPLSGETSAQPLVATQVPWTGEIARAVRQSRHG